MLTRYIPELDGDSFVLYLLFSLDDSGTDGWTIRCVKNIRFLTEKVDDGSLSGAFWPDHEHFEFVQVVHLNIIQRSRPAIIL